MTVRRRVLWIVVMLPVVLVAAGAFYVFVLFDPSSLAPRIETAVQAATGRQLTIGGKLHLSLLPSPTVSAEQVSFANRPGGSNRPMATLARLTAQIALWPLLDRRVEVERLVLVQPDILLEVDQDGVGNWQMSSPAASVNPAPAASEDTAKSPGSAPLTVDLRSAEIQNGTIAWHDARTGRSETVALRSLTITENGTQAPVALAGKLGLGTGEIGLQGSTGPLARLRGQGEGPWPVKLALTAADATLSLDGAIADPLRGGGVSLALQANVPALEHLAPLSPGRPLPALRDTSLTARVDIADPSGPFDVRDINLHSPLGNVTGEVRLTLQPRPDMVAQLKADRIDLGTLGALRAANPPAARGNALPPPPALPSQGSAGLIPDTPLGLASLRDADVDVTLAIGTLIERGVALSDLALHGAVKNGVLVVDRLAARLPQGTVSGTLRADATAAAPAVAATLQLVGAPLATLQQLAGMKQISGGIADLRADVSGNGDTPHAIAASLNGRAGLTVVGGQIDTGLAIAPLTSVMPIPALAEAAKGRADLRCLALETNFANGTGSVNTLVLDSNLLTVTGDGTVRMGPETLDLNLKPRLVIPGGTFVAVPVRVAGPWRAPRTAWNGPASQGMASFSAVIGTLAQTGGEVDCGSALKAARMGAAGTAPPPPAPGASKQSVPNLGNLLRQFIH